MRKEVSRRSILALALALTTPLTAGIALTADELFPDYQRDHWVFQEITRAEPPMVQMKEWVKNPIDAFVLAKLESEGLKPSPEADPIMLLRRASFDLIGLPPTPEEVEDFLGDKSPNAFEKVVDGLLASPHYGERWARHWLDLARYAESEGFKSDQTRPHIWRYRDYVIKSFNEDKPYDRFVREQIAGDELWPNDFDARVATAFNRHYPDEHNARNLMQRRQEILHDITTTVGSTFTGLTYGCARCHNHKFDPILQADYYRLMSFFANFVADDDIILASPEVVERHQRQMAEWEAKTAKIREEMAALEAPKRKEVIDEFIAKYPPEIQEVLTMKPEDRSAYQWLMFYKAEPYLNPESYIYQAPTSSVVRSLKDEDEKRWHKLKEELDQYAHLHPGELSMASGILDAGREAPKTYILAGGAYDAKGEEVQPGFLTMLAPGPAKIVPPEDLNSTGRRTALANWLADPKNPLTSRVMANRIWHYHFGRGIVKTPSNFGLSGELPTHPELLDWLATEFVRNGWSMKYLHRLIMLSNTYQQASLYREDAGKADPDNNLFWRYPRHRLEGEVIRDASLAVAGMLNTRMGGPSAFPDLPPGMDPRGGWKEDEDPAAANRRSIYVFVRRNQRYPMFHVFDMPDTHESCPAREITTSPLQALTMLNSELTLDWAQGLASRVLIAAGSDRSAQIDQAYRLAYSRLPNAQEKGTILNFLDSHRAILAERAERGEKLAEPTLRPHNVDPLKAAALVDFCHMLLNSNEFVYVN
ncbi:MAG: DUF1549 and DUF1553 domain-containing protein [Acidobacteriota bacterium]